jgi:hypothetical protein
MLDRAMTGRRIAVLAGTLALAGPPCAGAAINQGHYTVKTNGLTIKGGTAGGGTLTCPHGKRVVSGGSFWHEPGDPAPRLNLAKHTHISNAFALDDGRSWYTDGVVQRGGDLKLEQVLLCLPKALVPAVTSHTNGLVLGANHTNGGSATCGAGENVVAGGAYLHKNAGRLPKPRHAGYARIASSTAKGDGSGWYADAYNPSSLPTLLTIVAYCLPQADTGAYTLVASDVPVASLTAGGGPVSCPAGQRVVSGGGYWHEPGVGGGPTTPVGVQLSSSTPTTDGLGWYADGFNLHTSTPLELQIIALCVTPV